MIQRERIRVLLWIAFIDSIFVAMFCLTSFGQVHKEHKLDSGYYFCAFVSNDIWAEAHSDGTQKSGTTAVGAEYEMGAQGWMPIKSHHVYAQIYWNGRGWRWETSGLKEKEYSICCIGRKLEK